MIPTQVLALVGFVVAAGPGKPVATVAKFDGHFRWIRLPANAIKPSRTGEAIVVTLSFPKDAKLKRDPKGYPWFTFIVADQGPDWKWHQTSKAGELPVSAGLLRKGDYTVVVPTAGIPASVLRGAGQTLSIGPATSGLVKPVTFLIKGVQLR